MDGSSDDVDGSNSNKNVKMMVWTIIKNDGWLMVLLTINMRT